MPLIHDQFQAAERIEYMNLGPQAINRKALFPVSREHDLLFSDKFKSSDILVLIKEGVNQLERRLQMLSTPIHRLKCACFGRNLRDDPRENGVANASVIAWKLFTEAYTKRLDVFEEDVENASELHKDEKSTVNLHAEASQIESDKNTDCGEWQEFDCGLCLFTHHMSAPEETAFLYNEIFEQKVYLQNGIVLKDNDLVIDVGSNVGLFSVFAELEFLSSNALRIIAIEPMIENFNLLKKNLARYVPSAYVVQAAVGYLHCDNIISDDACDFDTENLVEGDQRENYNNLKNEILMTYFPHIPGNSCASKFVADKFNQHKRAHLLTEMREEMCKLQSLSAIIDESGFETNNSHRISLLKVDVEGAELDVLLSIDDRHWYIIDQIVIETAQPNKRIPMSFFPTQSNDSSMNQSENHNFTVDDLFENICTLLKRKNFDIIVEHDPSLGVDTGCVLIFAKKLPIHNH
jgi:FkbM family methyltransferase